MGSIKYLQFKEGGFSYFRLLLQAGQPRSFLGRQIGGYRRRPGVRGGCRIVHVSRCQQVWRDGAYGNDVVDSSSGYVD